MHAKTLCATGLGGSRFERGVLGSASWAKESEREGKAMLMGVLETGSAGNKGSQMG